MVDMVGMTRAQIADPHMVVKIRDGKEDRSSNASAPTIASTANTTGWTCCASRTPRPAAKHHAAHHRQDRLASSARSWWSVPGRPGWRRRGCRAERGHDVVLFEKKTSWAGRSTGGQGAAARADGRHHALVRDGDTAPGRAAPPGRGGRYRDDPGRAPDIVVLATGGIPHTGPDGHWGAAQGWCVSSWDILAGAVAPGRTCWSTTPSAPTGSRRADFIAARGRLVEIVTPE